MRNPERGSVMMLKRGDKMFCPKCGSELRDDAVFCDKCGAKLDARNGGAKIFVLSVLIMAIGLIAILVGVVLIMRSVPRGSVNTGSSTHTTISQTAKDPEKQAVKEEVSVLPETKQETSVSEPEKEKEPFVPTSFFEGEPVVELPSFVTFAKGRMELGDYLEDKGSGGYVQYFLAGDDTSVVNCIAEYRDTLAKYGVEVTSTLSSNDGEYNYTCYPCTYSGNASIKRGSINWNDCGECDLCFVTASKEGEAYIAAYVPEGVTFTETTEKMKNSY